MSVKVKHSINPLKEIAFLILMVILTVCFCGWKTNDENSYFFSKEILKKEYKGFFVPPSYNEVRQTINLNISEIAVWKEGTLYSLELDNLEPTDDPLDYIIRLNRHLGYFYITKDTIYRVGRKSSHVEDPIAFEAHETIKLMHLVQRIEQKDQTLFVERNIVCNEIGTSNLADENGWHEYVEVDGDKRIFHLYNDYTGGTKEYEQIVWEKGKGITYYLNGAGNMFMHIELGDERYRELKDE